MSDPDSGDARRARASNNMPPTTGHVGAGTSAGSHGGPETPAHGRSRRLARRLGGCPVAHAQSARAVTPAEAAGIEAGIEDLSMQWSTAILQKDDAILRSSIAERSSGNAWCRRRPSRWVGSFLGPPGIAVGQGSPCPASRTIAAASWPPLSRGCLRFGIPACACQPRRLPGHGHPLLDARTAEVLGWTRKSRPPRGAGLRSRLHGEFLHARPEEVRGGRDHPHRHVGRAGVRAVQGRGRRVQEAASRAWPAAPRAVSSRSCMTPARRQSVRGARSDRAPRPPRPAGADSPPRPRGRPARGS